jgi:pimeloyl-ACP methyl ester carboxylesterase
MGHIDAKAPQPDAFELPLPWGPVVRGVRWGSSPDSVLLLHEPGTDIDAWGPLPAQLANALRVEAVAVDLPGHGLSDDPWEPERLGQLVQMLLEVGDATPRPAHNPLPPSPGSTADRGRYGPFADHSQVSEPLSLRTGRGVEVRVACHERSTSPSPESTGEGEISPVPRSAGHRFIIAARSTSLAALAHANSFRLSGFVLLSPAAPPEWKSIAPGELPLSGGSTGETGRRLKSTVPKLIVAGSHAGDDLDTARRFASSSGGWTVVTSLPVSEQGTALLQTTWQVRLSEEVTTFLRDCMRRRPALPKKPSVPPRRLD